MSNEGKFQVFDKIKWHTENGMSFKEAKKHIVAIMDFLMENNLLSQEGLELYKDDGVTREFSLNSDLLTKVGDRLLLRCYKSYLRNFEENGKSEALKLLKQELNNEN